MFKEKLQPPFDVGETKLNQQREIYEEQDEAKLGYSFLLDSERRTFLVMDETFEFNVHEQMQQDDLQSDSSLPSDSVRSISSIRSETFEIDYNEYQNVSSCDSLDSETDGDGDYEDENDNDETNCNIDGKEGSLLSFTPSIYHISDEYEEEEEEEEDNLIEIHLLKKNFPNFAQESTQKMESKLTDFLSESIFKQQNLMQLLSEINDMNEDENLIEIDISM